MRGNKTDGVARVLYLFAKFLLHLGEFLNDSDS